MKIALIGIGKIANYQMQAITHTPGIKLIDVALSVGYDDPSHFSRSFRQICGVAPRRYRKTLLARPQSLRGALPVPEPRDQAGLNLECAFVSDDPPAAGQAEVPRPL